MSVTAVRVSVSTVRVSVTEAAVEQRVAVTVARVSVRVAVASVLESEDPDQVDDEAGHGDGQQALVVHVGRLQSPLTHRQGETQVQNNFPGAQYIGD